MRRPPDAPLGLGVLASGRGSNLQAILDATVAPGFPARVAVVVSDHEGAQALGRARARGVPAVWLNPKDFGDRAAYDVALAGVLEAHGVGLVCLAGFMRILGPAFVRAWAGRILNVHPALLPAFPGLHAQRQALEHGVKLSGATVHLVTEDLDLGPIVAQEAVAVLEGDTEETLAARILEAEHRIYPRAVRAMLEGRVSVSGWRVILEGA